jgi:pheromone shutdown-related protein TraB
MQIQVGENILLVGTAHVSKSSVEEVKAAIASFRPDIVAVELDATRHKAITQKDEWEATPFTRLLKGNTLYFFLVQTLLASYQRRMGMEEGVEPGAEMIAAIRAAETQGSEVVLADRDIAVTFRRAFMSMGFREKTRITWELMKALVGLEKEPEGAGSVDELLDHDIITTMMEELGEFAPSIKSVLIDERDLYLATRIREAAAEGKRIVAVVGAGHLSGIHRQLEDPEPVSLELLEELPKRGVSWGKVVAWAVPFLILGLFGFLFYRAVTEGKWDELVLGLRRWIIYNSLFAAIGAFLASGHILSILTAAVAAPITSLNPAMAAGWFAGIVEAAVRKPQVKDFQSIATIATLKDMYRNKVMRVILVAALANVGSIVGTIVGGYGVFDAVFGL